MSRLLDLEPVVIDAGTSHMNCVRFSPDNAILWTGGMDARLRLWSVGSWEDAGEWKGHGKSVNTLQLAAGGTRLVSGSTEKTVRIWSVPDGAQVGAVAGWQYGSATADLSRLAVSKDNNMVGIWDVAADSLERRWKSAAKRGVWMRWSADESQLLVGGYADTIELFEAATGELVRELDGHGTATAPPLWNPARTRLITAGFEGTCHVWDPTDWSRLATWATDKAGLWGRAWHPTESLVVLSKDHTVTFWDPEAGEELGHLKVKPKGVYQADISPDGAWLAVSAADKRVRVWSMPEILAALDR